MARDDDLRRVEAALTRISRVSTGRGAARLRSERSGVFLSRPAIAILASLRTSGPVRLTELARLTDLEVPLISREVRELTAGGHVRRTPDPTDGRAGIVELTARGRRASEAYRAATDEIAAETFAGWSTADLRTLAAMLERVVQDAVRVPRDRTPRAAAG
jgi:DNA-binding MarR family transcriptional regulator